MKDKKLRSMILDCVLHYKKLHGCWYERPYTCETILRTDIGCESLNVQSCLDLCKKLKKNPKQVYIYPHICEDHDGYPEHHIELYTNRKSSDVEWFEEISQAISPQWEKQRYDQYLQLKAEFE